MMSCMKGFSGIGGFLILILGLGMAGVTVWGFINSELTFNNYTLLGILIAMDFLIIGGAVIGIVGIKRANGLMIFIFQIFVMVFFVVFLGIGIGAQMLPKTVFQGDCQTSDNDLIVHAHKSYTAAIQLCTICPCGLTDNAIQNSSYTLDEQAALMLLNRGGEAINFQSCKESKSMDDTYQNVFTVLQSVEKGLDCSGWCEDQISLIYRFSDVNRGKPETFCYQKMKDALNSYGKIIGYSAFGVALFLMLVCICNLFICCSPSKRGMSYRERFVVNEGGYYRTVG